TRRRLLALRGRQGSAAGTPPKPGNATRGSGKSRRGGTRRARSPRAATRRFESRLQGRGGAAVALQLGSRGVRQPFGPAQGLRLWPERKEHTSELQSRFDLVCRLLLEKKKYEIFSWMDTNSNE